LFLSIEVEPCEAAFSVSAPRMGSGCRTAKLIHFLFRGEGVEGFSAAVLPVPDSPKKRRDS
jgi:hypothetical protein